MNLREKKILTVTCLGHFLSHFNMLVFPAVLLPLTKRLNLSLAEVLELSFWMYLLFGITAFPWGVAGDRWGVKRLFVLYYLGAGLSGFFVAWGIDSPAALKFGMAGIGFFSGIYHPIGIGWISKEVRQVSIGMGYNGMSGNLGLATAPLVAGVVNWIWSPREVYLVLGFLNLSGLALMMALRVSQDSRDTSWPTSEKGGSRLVAFSILLVAMMLGGIEYRGATVIMPTYLEVKNVALFQWANSLFSGDISKNLLAAGITSAIFLIGMGGQYFGGHLSSRFDLKLCLLSFHAVTVPAAFLMIYFSDVSLAILALVYFFFLLGLQPIENTLIAEYTPRKLRHSAFGFKFILTFGVGSLAIKIVGGIEKNLGLSQVFPFIGCVAVGCVCMAAVLIAKTRSDRPKRGRA